MIEISRPAFVSGHSRARLAIYLLGLTILLNLAAIGSEYAQIDLFNRAMRGHLITTEEADWSDNLQQVIGLAQLGVLVATGIVFLRWIHRVHKNLPALGATGLKYSSRWAAVWFIIPILNVWRPVGLTQEIWKASDPGCLDDQAWKSARSSRLLESWWGMFIASDMLGRFSTRLTMRGAPTLSGLVSASWITIAAEALDVVAALLAILVVRAIDARQAEKSKRVLAPAEQRDYITLG